MKLLNITIRFNKQQLKSGRTGINFNFIVDWKQRYISAGFTVLGLDIDVEVNK